MRRRFHRYKDQSAVVEKTSENFSNFKVRNNEAMKQIKIASSAEDRKRQTVGGEITNK